MFGGPCWRLAILAGGGPGVAGGGPGVAGGGPDVAGSSSAGAAWERSVSPATSPPYLTHASRTNPLHNDDTDGDQVKTDNIKITTWLPHKLNGARMHPWKRMYEHTQTLTHIDVSMDQM